MRLNCVLVVAAKRSVWKWLGFTMSRRLNMNRTIAQHSEQTVRIGM
jgi:hypothetical protein